MGSDQVVMRAVLRCQSVASSALKREAYQISSLHTSKGHVSLRKDVYKHVLEFALTADERRDVDVASPSPISLEVPFDNVVLTSI